MNNNEDSIISKKLLLPFILIVLCFAAWGAAANMTDPLVKVFSKIFSMTSLQSALVQFSYYGAYFCLALPAAYITRKFSYKVGVLSGLGLAAVGALMFYPASIAMTYSSFLIALFLLAGGLSILETSANPYVMAMGSERTATRRLNFAQAFNPVGTNIGVFLAASLILPNLHSATEAERLAMAPESLLQIQQQELQAVMIPYVSMAIFLLLIWLAIALTKSPVQEAQKDEVSIDILAILKRLASNRRYSFGVVAQFFNVGAQTCVWTFLIQYVIDTTGGNEVDGGRYLQYSMFLFLISRFVMTWLMGFVDSAKLLLVATLCGSILCFYAVLAGNLSGVFAVVAVSICLSLLFPTIYSLSLNGLGEDTKFGAAGLVMAILGGAIMPLVHGYIIDVAGVATSYIVPALCFLVVTSYAFFYIRTAR